MRKREFASKEGLGLKQHVITMAWTQREKMKTKLIEGYKVWKWVVIKI